MAWPYKPSFCLYMCLAPSTYRVSRSNFAKMFFVKECPQKQKISFYSSDNYIIIIIYLRENLKHPILMSSIREKIEMPLIQSILTHQGGRGMVEGGGGGEGGELGGRMDHTHIYHHPIMNQFTHINR